MTDPTSDHAPMPDLPRLPADPAKYDEARNVAARARGLAAPYIAGGDDPELGETLRRERHDLRLLIGMAAGLVSLGFVLGIAGVILTAAQNR